MREGFVICALLMITGCSAPHPVAAQASGMGVQDPKGKPGSPSGNPLQEDTTKNANSEPTGAEPSEGALRTSLKASELVVIGKVMNEDKTWSAAVSSGAIREDVNLLIEEVIKGKSAPGSTIRVFVVQANSRRTYLRTKKGQELILFLKNATAWTTADHEHGVLLASPPIVATVKRLVAAEEGK